MEGIKKFINIVVMLYLVVAALIYLGILNVGQASNPDFYTTFFLVGGAIMLLELIIENLYIMSLKRGQVHTQHKINELKAQLYDHKQELQNIKKRQTEEAVVPKPNVAPTNSTNTNERYFSKPAPVTPVPAADAPFAAAPAGSAPVPPKINSNTSDPDRPVIITPGQTSGSQPAESRFTDKNDSF